MNLVNYGFFEEKKINISICTVQSIPDSTTDRMSNITLVKDYRNMNGK